MPLLALDTSTRRVAAAIGSDAGVLGSVELGGPAATGPPRHVEQLAPAIRSLASETGVGLDALDAVAVGVGPGMFSGLRVGVTTAAVLADALSVPVIPLASHDVVAHPLRHARRAVVVAFDARRGEFSWTVYRPTADDALEADGGAALGSPGHLAGVLDALAPVVLAGDGHAARHDVVAARLEDPSRCIGAGADHDGPRGPALVALGVAALASGATVPVTDLRPRYLRRVDAEVARDGAA